MTSMFYIFSETDDSLKCSFCTHKFTDVVKLIPDCGESICGECSEALKESSIQAREFECKACHERHSMPTHGFPDSKSLSKILKKRKIEKPLGDKATELKSLILSSRERLRELEKFDKRDHVYYHCDQLEVEVMSAVESAINHFNEIEKDLLKEINEYRQTCLNGISVNSKDKTEEQKDQAVKINRGLAKRMGEISVLRKKMDEFHSKWNDFLTQIDTCASDQDIEISLNTAKQYKKKIESLDKKLKLAALNDKITTIKIQQQYFKDKALFKKLICFSSIDKTSSDMRIQQTPSCTLEDHDDNVYQVIYLPNDQMVSCSKDNRVIIRNGDERRDLAKFSEWPASLAQLLNGWLAIGLNKGEIRLWDIDAKREMRTLKGHTHRVVSLRSLKNGELVSYSNDDTIKIWDPFSDRDHLRMTINGHGNSYEFINVFGVSSSDILIACNIDEDRNQPFLRCWSPNDGKEIKSVSLMEGKVKSMLVLFDDQIALGFDNGAIKIIDLEDVASSRTEAKAYLGRVTAFAQFNNLILASAGNDNQSIIVIKLWNFEDLTLLQSIYTKHSEMINSLSISPDEKLIASASDDNTIKLWPILFA